MTTETVTVLFTDMVDSTALAAGLDPEAADDLRRCHFAILRQAVAQADGTEVKNLGDGLMVVFGAASAALSCAVVMQQNVDRENRGCERPVGVRVGLSGGEVSREDDDYFGDPIIEAARLCARGESGQILATDIVRQMAGRRVGHECRSIGGLALKGLPDPVETVEVVWEPLRRGEAGTAVPLPGRLAVGPAVGVVGRHSETTTMSEVFRRVDRSGGREVVLVSGEAGLGKTSLVGEVARAAFNEGACVLCGHCEEDLATPYQLFAEALGHYVAHAPKEQLAAHVAAHGPELARVVPALADRLPDLPPSKATDADTERFQLFAAVVGLLAQVSQRQPVVVVLDDLQWADEASLQLLRHIVAADHPMRVLVLGTYRDDEMTHSHPLLDTLAALHRHRGVSRIELAGLDDAGVAALMAAAAGHPLDDAALGLARALHRETDGNPFFVSEVLRHLAETGVITQDATGRWTERDAAEPLALPTSVRLVIGARVGRLGPNAERTLSMASVIGRDFDLDVLARSTQTADEDLLQVLDAAASASLVRELSDSPGHYSFAHALIQHTLYEDMGPTRRARAHRQVAEAMEDLYGDRPGPRVGELARHWINASQPIDLDKALGYSRQAADAALHALAPGDALRHYAQALDLYGRTGAADPTLGIDLSIGLGTAQRQTGDPTFRDTFLDAARRASGIGDTERLVAAALANSRGAIFSAGGVIDADRVEVLETALDLLSSSDPDRALVLATLCAQLTFGTPLERRQALADEALAIAEASGDDATIVRVLNSVLYPLGVPSLLEQCLSRSADALLRAERLGDPVLVFWAALLRASAAVWSADLDEMDRCEAIMDRRAEQLDQPTLHWVHTYVRSTRAQIAGDTSQADRLATEALQIGTDSGQPDATMFFGAQLGMVHFQRGTLGEFAPLLEQIIVDAPEISGTFIAGLAVAHVETGRIDEARRLLREFAAAHYELPRDPNWLSGMVMYAEVAIACRDPKYAKPLFDQLAPWAAQLPSSGVAVQDPVCHYLGGLATVLGRYDEADAYFSQAAAISQQADATFFLARTNLRWGQMYAGRQAPGDAERARDRLTLARVAAAERGYASIERRAAEALQGLS